MLQRLQHPRAGDLESWEHVRSLQCALKMTNSFKRNRRSVKRATCGGFRICLIVGNSACVIRQATFTRRRIIHLLFDVFGSIFPLFGQSLPPRCSHHLFWSCRRRGSPFFQNANSPHRKEMSRATACLVSRNTQQLAWFTGQSSKVKAEKRWLVLN